MSLEVKIHEAQLNILRELLFSTHTNYASLQRTTGLASDHFNFHINKLVELGFVERLEKGVYRLTLAGKEYANKLDTDTKTLERQPKTAVMLFLTQEIDGKEHFLVQQRTKNPNFNFYGFPTGKIRWGETIPEAARRELAEETGLVADFEVCGAYHEHVHLQHDTEPIEDKIFFICKASNVMGELHPTFEGGANHWLTLEALMNQPKRFSSVQDELKILQTDTWLVEKSVTYAPEVF